MSTVEVKGEKGREGLGSPRAGIPEGLFQDDKKFMHIWRGNQVTMRSSLDEA